MRRDSSAAWVAGVTVICLKCAALAVQSETNAVGRIRSIDPIVVTARAFPAPLSQTPGSVGIIDQEDMQARPVASISDLTALVPGMGRNADGPWGADVNIRGLSRDSVVLQIDGCRVNTATDISARFGLLDPRDVERIEVLKGPISALYGSGALGGVVNVQTRAGKFTASPAWRAGISADFGSNPQGVASHGFAELDSPDWAFYVSQTFRDYDSYRDGEGDTVRNSQFRDEQTMLKAGRRWSQRWTTEAAVERFEGRGIGIPGSGTAPLPAVADVTYDTALRELYSVVNTYTPLDAPLKESKLTVYAQRIERDVRLDHFPPANPVVEISPTGKHATYGVTWMNVVRVPRNDIDCGVDAWERRLVTWRDRDLRNGQVQGDEPIPRSHMTSVGPFVEDTVRLTDRWNANVGGRVDRVGASNEANAQWAAQDRQDWSWDAHAGTTWALTEALRAKAIVASGYRAPSLEERYQYLELGGGVVRYGNPDLDPERSVFAEGGLNWYGESLVLGLAVFQNRLHDLIGETYTDASTIVNANVDAARIYGVEGEARWEATSALEIYGNAAWSKGEDLHSHAPLADIAPLSGLVGVKATRRSGLWARVETVFAGPQNDVPSPVEPAAGWATVQVRCGKDFTGTWLTQRVYAGVDNLFDKTYRNDLSTARGTPFDEPGRAFVAGYELDF